MKQLVVLSGKGGTGKTSLVAAFVHLANQEGWEGQVVLADADVDAANLELVVQPSLIEKLDFKGNRVAVIQREHCTACGVCGTVCRFDAILCHFDRDDGIETYSVDPTACEGCAACMHQCPSESISLIERVAGEFHYSLSRYGPLYHAHLFAGQENSGKLVTLVKQRARLDALENYRRLLLVDGPPGIGCAVISAISGANLALVVTEPSVSGIHDLKRAIQTLRHFKVPALVVINKADLYPQATIEIETNCRENGIEIVGSIPFDLAIPRAMIAGQAVTAYEVNSAAACAIRHIWEHLASRHLS